MNKNRIENILRLYAEYSHLFIAFFILIGYTDCIRDFCVMTQNIREVLLWKSNGTDICKS